MFSPQRVRFLTRCRDGERAMTQRRGKGERESRVGRKHLGEWRVKRGRTLGPQESCHKSLFIRERFICAVERQKTACFSALISHGQRLQEKKSVWPQL